MIVNLGQNKKTNQELKINGWVFKDSIHENS